MGALKKIVIFLSLFSINSCYNQSQNLNNENYEKAKSEFREELRDHFPDKLNSERHLIVYTTNLEKNNIILQLCEYDLESSYITKIKQNCIEKGYASYNSSDSCLLIVNRFETLETSRNLEVVTSFDKTKVEQQCFEELKPIPNFIDVKNPVKHSEIKLNDSYTIFVLESKAGKLFPEYDLLPNPQMPLKWKNGYSKGIAVSEKERTVIYWSIVW